MLPSRGLRPTNFTALTSRQSTAIHSNASRKFSSLPRTAGLSAPSSRTGALQSSRWRAGATSNSHIALNASSVRYGSWYAPWSWGKTSTGTETVAVGEFSSLHSPGAANPSGPAVTSTTPELAPEHIERTTAAETATNAPVGGSSSPGSVEVFDDKTLEEVLAADPVKDKADIDPTQLIDHAGQLRELGLDYGYGMTTTFEKLIETMYLQSGWGWAGSIMATTLVVRCGLFVFQSLSSNNLAAMAAMKPVTQPIQEKLDAAIAEGDNAKVQLLKMQQAQIMKPFVGGSLAMFGFMACQMWVGVSAFRFLRAMGDLPVPGMAQDGYLWFTDLTSHDPYYVLPAATSAIMYTIFKKGGETGVQNDVGAAGMTGARSKMMSVLALGMGVFTCWQPAGLQLYFLTSSILGGFTGFLLRKNGFRKAIGIRPMPTPESNAIFSKIAEGKLKLQDVKGPDGKIRYQPPKVTSSSSSTTRGMTTQGIRIKGGVAMPVHMKPEAPSKVQTGLEDRDVDFEEGATGSLSEKLDYYRRNYRLAYVQRRFANGARNMMKRAGYSVDSNKTPEQERRKRRAEQYEVERRRRFENRQ